MGACTTTHVLRTAHTPGTRVRIDCVTPRDIDVLVGGGRDSVPFDAVSVVTGRVMRVSADLARRRRGSIAVGSSFGRDLLRRYA